MKTRTAISGILLWISLALIGGCASTPAIKDATFGAVFQQPVEPVKKAAVDALVVIGFDITKQEPMYIEGFRPRKMGLFVGSGGETVGVWLTAQGSGQTKVKVDTAKSLIGIVGQRNWEPEILNEMTKSLKK